MPLIKDISQFNIQIHISPREETLKEEFGAWVLYVFCMFFQGNVSCTCSHLSWYFQRLLLHRQVLGLCPDALFM
jgi:hypothetical protein